MLDKDNIIILTILIISVIFFGLSFYIPTLDNTIPIYRYELGARIFPQIVLMGIIILSMVIIYKNYKIHKSAQEKRGSDSLYQVQKNKRDRSYNINIFLLVILFSALFNWLGAFASMFLFVFFYIWNKGMRKISTLILTPTGVVLSVYLIFYRLLSVRLPKGIFSRFF